MWARNSYTLTLTNGLPAGISALSGAGDYDFEDTVNISATIKTGYTFTGWTSSNTTLLPNSAITANASTFSMPAGDLTLTAHAQANTYYVR